MDGLTHTKQLLNLLCIVYLEKVVKIGWGVWVVEGIWSLKVVLKFLHENFSWYIYSSK